MLDRYYTAHLQDTRGGWLGDERSVKHIEMLDEIVGRLFAPLRGERRPFTEWFEPVLEVLRNAYGEHADIAPVWRAKWDDPDVMPLCYAPAAWQSRRKGDALWWDVR